MTDPPRPEDGGDTDARRRLDASRERQHHGDVPQAIALARAAVDQDPAYVDAIEHLATLLITRRRAYDEGLQFIEKAAALRAADPGTWYALGWCYEFAAHEIARRGGGPGLDPRALYARAAEGFRRCLALHPDGKLADDAGDLLDHVENRLQSQ